MARKINEMESALQASRAYDAPCGIMAREDLAAEIKKRVEARFVRLREIKMTSLKVWVEWDARALVIWAEDDKSVWSTLWGRFIFLPGYSGNVSDFAELARKAALAWLGPKRYVDRWAGKLCSWLVKEEARLVKEGKLEKQCGLLAAQERSDMREEIKAGRHAKKSIRL